MTNVNGYTAILSARLRVLLQYRAAAAAGFATQLFWGLIRMMIFAGFYASSTTPQPLAYSQVVTYVWLGQAMFAMFVFGVDRDVRAMVRTGTVAYELLRPLDLYTLWFVRAIALRTAPTLLRAVPMFVIAGLFFGMQPPPSWEAALGWVAATLGALLLTAALWTLVTITLLWTVSGEGAQGLVSALAYCLSGILVPLPLFPDWAQPVLEFLPFRGMIDVPFRVYLGDIAPERLPAALAHQFVWALVLLLAGRWLLARAARRLVVQGG